LAKAKHGDTVRVHYMGTLADGTVFGTTVNSKPLQFIIGKGQLIHSFEEAVLGMEPGESKIVKMPMAKAFGPHKKEMVKTVDRGKFPNNMKLEIGQQLRILTEDRRRVTITVTGISEQSVTLDANHPLAGKDLTFDIRLVEIA
jgi:peptidylprolyl isomerase